MSDESKSIRYGDYVSQVSVKYRTISYNDLTPKPAYDEDGAEIPYSPPPVKLTQFDIYQLFYPYVNVRFIEQISAVAPFNGLQVSFPHCPLEQVSVPVLPAHAPTPQEV